MTKTGLFVLIVTAAIIAAFAWTLSGLHAAAAAGPGQCKTISEIETDIRRDFAAFNPQLTLMGKEAAAKYLAIFNAEPPASEITADALMFVTGEGQEKMMMAIFKGDCFAALAWISKAMHEKVLAMMGRAT